MSLEIKESNENSKRTVDVFIDGEHIGNVMEKKPEEFGSTFHACINVPGAPFMMSLAQGHGESIDDAIENAFISSMNNARQYMQALTVLKKQVSA